MRKHLLTVLLLACCCGGLLAGGDERDVFRKWMSHVGSVYYTPLLKRVDPENQLLMLENQKLMARIMGYALSLQLKYIRRDTSEHRIWQMLEEQSRRALVEEAKVAAQRAKLNENAGKELETALLKEFATATVGWLDDQMAFLTKINQNNAPNYFDILKNSREEGPPPVRINPVPTPADPVLPSDAILGKWTVFLTGREDIPENRMSVVVRKADGADPKKYEAHYSELGENLTRHWGYQPGQLAWKVTFLRERQGRLDYEISIHYRTDTGPPNQRRDVFRGPAVYTMDPSKPGFLLRSDRPIWQR